jgi:hypothetical protein
MIAPKPKKSGQHAADLAKGGKGAANKMFGKQAAGKTTPGHTGKVPIAASGKRAPRGR